MSLTLANELDAAAQDSPSRVFLRSQGEDVTYADMAERVERRARHFASAGVRHGDAVALMMDNSVEQVVTWFGLSKLGALHAPLNPALTSQRLGHALSTARAMLLVCDESHLQRACEAIDDASMDLRIVTSGDLANVAPSPKVPVVRQDDTATATLLFTSGTTGPAKACALSHRYLVRQGQLHVKYTGVTAEDVLYCPFPLFHIDAATLTVVAALCARATAALGVRFSASGFWDEVRRVDATIFNFMGATLTILWKRDPTAGDRDHRVRLAWGVPMPAWQRDFEKRFGFPLRQVYGLTDGGIPVYDPPSGDQRPGCAGRVIPEFEVRIDESRRRVVDAAGAGEILIRGREPGLMMNEYYGNPVATAETLVTGWLRTGDIGALDADAWLTFHGRLSDSIRRRGENISAFEVEELVASHPDVLEASAVGVPSEMTDEDVKVWVVPKPGSALRPRDLHRELLQRGPRYMVPRYYEFVVALPKTPTQKVEKFKLRQAGNTDRTWDAELPTAAEG